MRTAVFLLSVAFLSACNGTPLTSIIIAARNGDAPQIRALAARGANVNEPAGVNGWTPLEHAIHKNQLGAVQALLDAGADPNAANPGGLTPLIMAAGYGYTPIVELLLHRGANPRLRDVKGNNALDAALSGTGDIDRFTLLDCQKSTVGALRREVPGLSPRGRTELDAWAKRCR
jgi:ankyrin repeat protein